MYMGRCVIVDMVWSPVCRCQSYELDYFVSRTSAYLAELRDEAVAAAN